MPNNFMIESQTLEHIAKAISRSEMKTFTATQLNKSPQQVFAAAKEDGTVLIEHDRFNGCFAIVWNPNFTEDEVLQQMRDFDKPTKD
jgi:hypothetical protein